MGKSRATKNGEYIFRVQKIPMPDLPDLEFQKLIAMRADGSWLWNSLVDYHRWARLGMVPYFSMFDLAKQMTGMTHLLDLQLSTQSQNLIFQEFLGVCETTRSNRKNALAEGQAEGWKTSKYPWRQRKGGRDIHFDRRDCKAVNGGISFTRAREINPDKAGKLKNRESLFIPYAAGIPKNTKVITIHYDPAEKRFFLLFKIKEKKPSSQIDSDLPLKFAGIDLGQIRWAVVITEDGKNLNLKGRGFRAIHQEYAKKLAFRQSSIDLKKRGSHNRRKAAQKKTQVIRTYHRRKENFLHTNSRKVVNFLKIRKITDVFVGDCRSVAQKESGGRQNQANSSWPIGDFFSQLSYKGAAENIGFQWQSERYSTRQCPDPQCLVHNRVKGRVFKCKACNLVAHRDAVGAWNILSFGMETCRAKPPSFSPHYIALDNQRYRAPTALKGTRRKILSPLSTSKRAARSGEQPIYRGEDFSVIVIPQPSDELDWETSLSQSLSKAAQVHDTDQTPRAGDVLGISEA